MWVVNPWEWLSGRVCNVYVGCLLYEGAAERIEAVSKSSWLSESMAARAKRGTSSAKVVAIMISGISQQQRSRAVVMV